MDFHERKKLLKSKADVQPLVIPRAQNKHGCQQAVLLELRNGPVRLSSSLDVSTLNQFIQG